ncbi:Aste57867_10565 [Aphanomyces stellatus]|uniref:Aste57867_10565 protein n=1 Tax=Aphanomyces stellatus TaxID=120398 RepID=A0A485KRQ4_9STRA|nr:hypothetical protein As57867_010525 [Aphanomyces stellatus]VFT87438.1 Aste57867_10565 [Aphanomyces stellatus]
MLRSFVAAATVAIVGVRAFENYVLPSYDLNLDTDHPPLVSSLATHGVAALRNIAGFAATREAYAHAAFACMRAHPTLEALLHKQLEDGTDRTTISTNADGSTAFGAALATHCPAVVTTQKAYAALLQTASLQLAHVLAASADASASSLVDVVARGQHLDHIHAYTSPPSSVFPSFFSSPSPRRPLSLDMHTDNGMFLLTSAPFYFDAATGAPQLEDASGLVLQLAVDGVTKQVMPRLTCDELVVMIGEGYARWGSYGHAFPAVLHAMQMPEGHRPMTRLFTGRMVLLPKDTTLAQSQMSFGDYADATTRFVRDPRDDDATRTLSVLGCPVGSTMLASDLSCTLGIWAPSNASDVSTTKEMCMHACNAPNMKKEVETCAALKCVRSDQVMDGGTVCWMLCVPHLDTCAVPDQVCVDQTLVCPAPSATWQFWNIVAYAAGVAVAIWALVLLWQRCTNPTTQAEKAPLLA